MTVWLTRILPDLRHPAARRDLHDTARMHKRVMSLIPDGLGPHARHQAGVLYRIDETRTGIQILIQTLHQPDHSRLPDRYGDCAVRQLDPLLAALDKGQTVHYRLAGNPSKRLGRTADRPGTIAALRGAAADQWWATRADRCGLNLRSLTAIPQPDATGHHHTGHIRHAVTRFDGLALITDPQALRAAILAGIGRGKSYGCGLLSIHL